MGIPMMLEVKNKKILIVGGGNISYRKASTLVRHHADVRCVSPHFHERFDELSDVKRIQGVYDRSMLDGMDYVIAATDERSLNGAIYNQCQEDKVMCMTVDHKNPSDFSFMAYREKQDLILALSTKGKSPKFAKEMIDQIMALVDESYFSTLKEYIHERETNATQRLDEKK